MSKYPITVERLKSFVLVGHSNADGWAPNITMFETYRNLFPQAYDYTAASTDNFFKNIYVATAPQPWPSLTGTPVAADIGDVEWLELTTNIPSSPNDAHPHPSPYYYPNNRGSCYPIWFHRALIGNINDVNACVPFGTYVGVETPLACAWMHYWQQQVGFIKVAFSSSLFMRFDRGVGTAWLNPNSATPADAQWQYGSVDTENSGQDFLAYWTPHEHFDWVPATKRFYQKWYDKMVGAQAALPSGSKMDVQLLILWFGDNDSQTQTREHLEMNFESSVRAMVKRMRQDCVDNDWTTLAAEQICVVWPGIQEEYAGGDDDATFSSVDFCNGVLQRVAADDNYMRWLDPSGWSTLTDEGFDNNLATVTTDAHYGPTGYFLASQDIIDAFQEMQSEPFDAISEDDRVTVSELRDRVRTYYNRSRTNTDIDDVTFLIHANGALNRILNDVGDNAYWNRRRNQLDISIGPGSVTTMPKYVTRVLKIEDSRDARYGLKFQQIGFAEGGKLQIQLEERGSANSSGDTTGAYVVHYITRPRDLTADEQLVPLPRTIIEWLVVETVRRLARSGSNVLLQGSMEMEARDLRERCLKELQVMQRAKKDRLHTVRRWPTLRYRRGN